MQATSILKFVGSDATGFYYVMNENEEVIGILKWRNNWCTAENHLSKLEALIEQFTELGSIDNFWTTVKSVANWGNGWEWEEQVPSTAKNYSISSSVSWYTTTTKNELSVDTFCKEENINIDFSGIKIHLRNQNNQPTPLCYYFRVK